METSPTPAMPAAWKHGSCQKRSSYKITVSTGYDIRGKQIRQHITWTPPPSMTARQLEKELKRQEVLFEEACKSRQIFGGSIKMTNFAELWFRDYAEKQLKPRAVANYRFLLKRVNDGLGHIRLDRIQPRQILSFYDNLANDNIRLDNKYALQSDLKGNGFTQAEFSHEAGLSLNTIESAISGNNVSSTSAEKISRALEMPLTKLSPPVKKGSLPGKTLLHYHQFLSAMLEKHFVLKSACKHQINAKQNRRAKSSTEKQRKSLET